MKDEIAAPLLRFDRGEISGSLGDLGTFLPLTLGYITRCGLSPAPVFFFAGLWNVATGLMFRLPIPVQPMKAIAAAAIAEGMTPPQIAAAGIIMGALLLVAGIVPGAGKIFALTPKAVVRGIQLGIGLKLFLGGISLLVALPALGWDSAAVGCAAIGLIVLSYFRQRIPAALLLFLGGLLLLGVSRPEMFRDVRLTVWSPFLVLPRPADWVIGFTKGAVAQLPLTLLNSVVAVCALSGDLFPGRKVPETAMARSVGVMNLVSCWFGGMPLCHGSGGLAGQYRFGARTGGSVVALGTAKMAVGLFAAGALLLPLQEFPRSILGAMLVFAGLELSLPARDTGTREDFLVCLLTAGLILSVNVTLGFLAGVLLWAIFRRWNNTSERKGGANG